MPPGGHSAWSLAATFTASPCRSVPSGNRVADVDPNAKADGPIGGLIAIVDWQPAAAPSRHSAPPRRCCRTRSAGSRRRSGRSCHHAPRSLGRSGRCGESAAVRASRRHPARSGGCSRPCRHRRRRSACVRRDLPDKCDALVSDMSVVHHRSALPSRLAQTVEHVFVVLVATPGRAVSARKASKRLARQCSIACPSASPASSISPKLTECSRQPSIGQRMFADDALMAFRAASTALGIVALEIVGDRNSDSQMRVSEGHAD